METEKNGRRSWGTTGTKGKFLHVTCYTKSVIMEHLWFASWHGSMHCISLHQETQKYRASVSQCVAYTGFMTQHSAVHNPCFIFFMLIWATSSHEQRYIFLCSCTRVLARIFAIGGALCIINHLGGLVNNGCGQLHVAICNTEKQSKTNVNQRPADFIWWTSIIWYWQPQ